MESHTEETQKQFLLDKTWMQVTSAKVINTFAVAFVNIIYKIYNNMEKSLHARLMERKTGAEVTFCPSLQSRVSGEKCQSLAVQ